MSVADKLSYALAAVRQQETRVILLEKLLVMALLGSEGQALVINPKFADAAALFDGGLDIGNGQVKLVSSEGMKKNPPVGVSIRMSARTFDIEQF